MTTLNIVGLMVAGWVIGDVITMATLVVNRKRIRGMFNAYVAKKQSDAVNAYIATQSYNATEADFDQDEEEFYNN